MLKLYKNEVVSLTTDTGRRRNNEDSIMEVAHPLNKNYKLLAVADGVGGCPNGEQASSYVLNKLKKYFMLIPLFVYKDIDNTKELLEKIINNINDSLVKRNEKFYKGLEQPATTLTCAIILDDKTIVASIGDSRAYIIKENILQQITEDNSYVWTLYKNGIITKDEIRFRIDNNIITKCLGRKDNNDIEIKELNNNEYTSLILCTDGVTDCLSDKKIQNIVVNSSTDDIANELVYEAVHINQLDIVPKGEFFEKTKCGKDNSSAVVLKKIKVDK